MCANGTYAKVCDDITTTLATVAAGKSGRKAYVQSQEQLHVLLVDEGGDLKNITSYRGIAFYQKRYIQT